MSQIRTFPHETSKTTWEIKGAIIIQAGSDEVPKERYTHRNGGSGKRPVPVFGRRGGCL